MTSKASPHSPNVDIDLHDEPELSSSRFLVRTDTSVSIPLDSYKIEGVGSGSLSDVVFRPNASFQKCKTPIFDEGKRLTISYIKALLPINRNLQVEEILTLLRAVLDGHKIRSENQVLYVYPGLEAFGIDALTHKPRIGLINVRPLDRYTTHSHDLLSVEAFLKLIQVHCPSGWKKIEHQIDHIRSLYLLDEALSEGSWSLKKGLSRLFWLFVFILIMSIPISIWGPPSVKEPILNLYQRGFNQLQMQLESRHIYFEKTQSPFHLTLTLHFEKPLTQARWQSLKPRLLKAIQRIDPKLTFENIEANPLKPTSETHSLKSIEGQIQPSDQSTEQQTYNQISITIKEYWGHPATLIKRLKSISIEGELLQFDSPNLYLKVPSTLVPKYIDSPSTKASSKP